MKVQAADVRRLLLAVREQYLLRQPGKESNDHSRTFYEGLTRDIANAVREELEFGTLYKTYFIGARTTTDPVFSASQRYLDALARYGYGRTYLEHFGSDGGGLDAMPDYPEGAPMFPATPARRIDTHRYDFLKDFREIYIKDESLNPNGTVVDRKAHEVYKFFKQHFRDVVSRDSNFTAPRLSMLDAGFNAYTIQLRLRAAGLAGLKVLLDKSAPDNWVRGLQALGAECEVHDLAALQKKGRLRSSVLELTNNQGGLDVSFGPEFAPLRDRFYRNLAYEVLALSPDSIVVTYGAGEVLVALVSTYLEERGAKPHGKWFFGDIKRLEACRFLGVGSDDRKGSEQFASLRAIYNVYGDERIDALLRSNGVADGSQRVIVRGDREAYARARQIMDDHGIKASDNALAPLAYFLENMESFDPKGRHVILNAGCLNWEGHV